MGMETEMQHTSGSENLNDLMNNPDYTSPYDDLAFEMYVDVDIAKVIREMENKKHLAVISR